MVVSTPDDGAPAVSGALVSLASPAPTALAAGFVVDAFVGLVVGGLVGPGGLVVVVGPAGLLSPELPVTPIVDVEVALAFFLVGLVMAVVVSEPELLGTEISISVVVGPLAAGEPLIVVVVTRNESVSTIVPGHVLGARVDTAVDVVVSAPWAPVPTMSNKQAPLTSAESLDERKARGAEGALNTVSLRLRFGQRSERVNVIK
jgi:hypothetical protein